LSLPHLNPQKAVACREQLLNFWKAPGGQGIAPDSNPDRGRRMAAKPRLFSLRPRSGQKPGKILLDSKAPAPQNAINTLERFNHEDPFDFHRRS
jgi:hypothetical protein